MPRNRNGVDYDVELGRAEMLFDLIKDKHADSEEAFQKIVEIESRLGKLSSNNSRDLRTYSRIVSLATTATEIMRLRRRDKPQSVVTIPPAVERLKAETMATDNRAESPQNIVAAANSAADFIEENLKGYGAILSVSVLEEYKVSLVSHRAAVGTTPSGIGLRTFERIKALLEQVNVALELVNKSKEKAAPEKRAGSVTSRLGIVVREGQTERLMPQTFSDSSVARTASRNMLKRLVPDIRQEEHDEHIDIGSTDRMITIASARTGKVYMTAVIVLYDAYAKDHPSNVVRETP